MPTKMIQDGDGFIHIKKNGDVSITTPKLKPGTPVDVANGVNRIFVLAELIQPENWERTLELFGSIVEEKMPPAKVLDE